MTSFSKFLGRFSIYELCDCSNPQEWMLDVFMLIARVYKL